MRELSACIPCFRLYLSCIGGTERDCPSGGCSGGAEGSFEPIMKTTATRLAYWTSPMKHLVRAIVIYQSSMASQRPATVPPLAYRTALVFDTFASCLQDPRSYFSQRPFGRSLSMRICKTAHVSGRMYEVERRVPIGGTSNGMRRKAREDADADDLLHLRPEDPRWRLAAGS